MDEYDYICGNAAEQAWLESGDEIVQLKQENEVLRSDLHNSELNLQIMTDLVAQLKELADRRLEALRKCSPFDYPDEICKFCKFDSVSVYDEVNEKFVYQDHAENCEFLQLTKESEDEG